PLVVEVDGVDQGAVDVQLELVGGGVADPDRRGALVPLQVRQLAFGQLGAAVDAVHDLQRSGGGAVAGADVRGQELHEGGGLAAEAEPEQRVDGEGGVAHPHVAVVPVALAAELLGQAGGGRGDDGAGGGVGEELQGEGGAVHHLAPAAPVAGL